METQFEYSRHIEIHMYISIQLSFYLAMFSLFGGIEMGVQPGISGAAPVLGFRFRVLGFRVLAFRGCWFRVLACWVWGFTV